MNGPECPVPSSDLAHLKSADCTPADPFLEWREANLERVAVEVRRRERSRTALRSLETLHRRRFPALAH
jgi:hypothetical protein